jgi:hypothetical protein
MWKLTLGYGGVCVHKGCTGCKNHRTFILYFLVGPGKKMISEHFTSHNAL